MNASSRRKFLAAAGGLAAATLAPTVSAQMTRTPLNNMPEVIRRLVGTNPVNQGRVKLDIPPLVENGHLVPLTVNVESPMTEADHVKAIHVFTERNPLPEMATFRIGPRAGRARVATRVRLADTQNVIAIAQMSDGTFWSDKAFLIVTLAACLEELPA
jgi:sulfur-oxidizing protein SoxY